MMLCIGGVCVPYTAVVPILILGFKWFAGKLAQMGLLPKFLQDLLQIHPQQQASSSDEKTSSSCNGDSSSCTTKETATTANKEGPTGPSLVQVLESEEDFPKIVNSSDKVVCKFTAIWCKPCHKIQPFFEQCSSKYSDKNIGFITIDVDDYDPIATYYNVAMMPTFIILEGENVLGKYAGSCEHELQIFLQQHLD